ncbi:MAG: hypothetical protein HC927_05655 [Deltaproteobacteria bacterium]|nr:hypothetical protein [Deltaproteobacteria bacterium]
MSTNTTPLAATTTNDASLMQPVNVWGNDLVVAAWSHWNFVGSGYPGFYAVTASQDATTVTLTPSGTGGQVQAGGGVANNGTGVVMLDEGDVLQVMSSGGDLTGTQVNADKPIQVIGGHECTNVPLNVTACDHLEESMFPVQSLAKEYIVAPPVQVPNTNLLKAQIVRVVATEANTAITFDPDQGANQVLTNAGDFIELPMTQAAFKVSGDKPILVVQYMVGQSAGFGTSDPAMLLTVPTAQYRNDYLFHAAPSWQANFVDIIARRRDGHRRRGQRRQLDRDRGDRVLDRPRLAEQRRQRQPHRRFRSKGRYLGLRRPELRQLLVPGRVGSRDQPAVK